MTPTDELWALAAILLPVGWLILLVVLAGIARLLLGPGWDE